MNGSWREIELAGKKADIYELPPGRTPRGGVIYLHSYARETLRDNLAFTSQFALHDLVCICPSGGHAWWGDHICYTFDPFYTPEQFLKTFVIQELNVRWGFLPNRIGLLGVSMGGQGAIRLALKSPQIWSTASAISPVLDFHELYGQGSPLDPHYSSQEDCRQDTAPMQVRQGRGPENLFFCCDPADQRWFRGNNRFHNKLNAVGIFHDCDLTSSWGGHTWDYFNRMAPRAIQFLATALERQSRKLPQLN